MWCSSGGFSSDCSLGSARSLRSHSDMSLSRRSRGHNLGGLCGAGSIRGQSAAGNHLGSRRRRLRGRHCGGPNRGGLSSRPGRTCRRGRPDGCSLVGAGADGRTGRLGLKSVAL